MKWIQFLEWGIVAAAFVAVGVVTLRRSDTPVKLGLKWVGSAMVLGCMWFVWSRLFQPTGSTLGGFGAAFALALGTVVCCLVLGIIWAPSIIGFVTNPITRLLYDEADEAEPTPLYSIAEAKRKRGLIEEAVQAVEEQLERFPGDPRGTLLLARIQAEDLHDLSAAEATLEALISPDDGTHAKAVTALNQIADWRLSLAHDLEGARAALERIGQLCPDSEAALMAGQRLAHLTHPEMAAGHDQPPSIPYVEFPVPERVGDVVDVRPKQIEPGEETAQLVEHLKRYPDDIEARERLATLYGEHYHRIELARAELNYLLAMKHAPWKKITAWLNRLADFEIRVAGDIDAARAALQRIIKAKPNAAAAEQARRRILTLERELRVRRPS